MKKIILLLSAVVLSAGGFAQTLIGHWNFTNGTAVDVSGHSLNGIIYGGVTPAAGRDGIANTALRFNGTNGYIRVPDDPSMNLTTWTLSAIVKVQGFYSGNCEDNCILERGMQYGSDYYNILFFDNAYDTSCGIYTPTKEIFAVSVAGANPTGWNLTNFVDTATWHCVTGTYENDTVKIYVDGIIRQLKYCANQYSYNGTPRDLFFGSSSQNTSPYPYWFNGLIDDIKIWNGALSADSVAALCAKHDTLVSTEVNEMHGEEMGIVLAPNPARGFTNVVLPLSWNEAQVSVFNTMGQTVMSQSVSDVNATINIQELPVGMYIVRIEHNGVVVNRRLAKQ